jgi:hypothetical protein
MPKKSIIALIYSEQKPNQWSGLLPLAFTTQPLQVCAFAAEGMWHRIRNLLTDLVN